MYYRLQLIILLFCTCLNCNSQDTLVFSKLKDTTKTYRLLLSQFPVQIKFTDSISFNAIIDELQDSLLLVRQLKKTLVIDSQITKLKNDFLLFSNNKSNSRKQIDSAKTSMNREILHTRYSSIRSIQISRIKSITVNNIYRPEKRRTIKLVNAAGITFIAATLISVGTQNPYIIGAGCGLTALYFIAKSSILSDKFELKARNKKRTKNLWKLNTIK